MGLYIDSAVRHEVEPLLALGVFSGVTTNPTILHRAGLAQDAHREVYEWMVNAGAGEVFFQARGVDRATLHSEGSALARIGDRVVVKLPATPDGIAAAVDIVGEGAPVLLTAVYHPAQAILAREVGARYIAPYVGRMTDQGRDGVRSVATMVDILRGSTCRILAASLRSADDISILAASGVPDFTLSTQVCEEVLADELTVKAAQEFESVGL